MKINHSPSYYYRLPKLARLVTINMYTVKQRGGKLMKVKLNINSNLNEEKTEFWIKKMTTKIEKYVLLKYQKNTIPVYGT